MDLYAGWSLLPPEDSQLLASSLLPLTFTCPSLLKYLHWQTNML